MLQFSVAVLRPPNAFVTLIQRRHTHVGNPGIPAVSVPVTRLHLNQSP